MGGFHRGLRSRERACADGRQQGEYDEPSHDGILQTIDRRCRDARCAGRPADPAPVECNERYISARLGS
ncbi:hypothetical protein MYA_4858 [Burkholderia sp. KJ006]|nr:hypothetical protein MYA_4858 [Burkholderia sp. KJ006]